MKQAWLAARLELAESLHARWFHLYAVVFGGLVVLMFFFGLTESRVMGFVGLSRLLVTYLQLTIAILPVFILVTTVRSVVGDREAGVYEYLLSLPIGLGAWYWGKLLGRFLLVFAPVAGAMAAAAAFGAVRGLEVPWAILAYYTGLLAAISACFLGIGMLISVLARSTDLAQGLAFFVWLLLLLFMDLILLGLMVQGRSAPETVVAVALANPLQVFRTGALAMFDPQLTVLGPTSYLILDGFGLQAFRAFALGYPTFLGLGLAAMGYRWFRRHDLQ